MIVNCIHFVETPTSDGGRAIGKGRRSVQIGDDAGDNPIAWQVFIVMGGMGFAARPCEGKWTLHITMLLPHPYLHGRGVERDMNIER